MIGWRLLIASEAAETNADRNVVTVVLPMVVAVAVGMLITLLCVSVGTEGCHFVFASIDIK